MQISAAAPLPLAPADAPADREEALREAAEGFEALFLATLLKGACAGLPGDELTGGSAVRRTQEMLDAELAQSSAGRAGLGIADAVMRQFGGAD